MDQELISYLDGHFQTIATRFDRVEERFDRVEERLDQVEERLDRVEERLLRAEDAIRDSQKAIEANGKAIEANETAIRHTDIKVEALRGEIRLVAEGVAAVNEKLDQLKSQTEASHEQLNRRVTRLEQRASFL